EDHKRNPERCGNLPHPTPKQRRMTGTVLFHRELAGIVILTESGPERSDGGEVASAWGRDGAVHGRTSSPRHKHQNCGDPQGQCEPADHASTLRNALNNRWIG